MDGNSSIALFNKIRGIAISSDSSYLYLSDYVNNRICRVDLMNVGYNSITVATGISGPYGIVMGKNDQVLYVVSQLFNAVYQISTQLSYYPIQLSSKDIVVGSTKGNNVIVKP